MYSVCITYQRLRKAPFYAVFQSLKKLQVRPPAVFYVLGVTRQSISRWEQNQAYPEMEKILRLSDILGVSCDYLLKENVTKKDCDTVGKGKPFMQTRLLKGLVGKKVKIDLLDGDIDVDYFDKVCEILGFEEDFMKVSYVKNKETEINLIDISKIASLELVED